MATKQQREEMMRTFARFNFECPMVTGGNAGTLIEILEKLHRYETTLRRIADNQSSGWEREVEEIRNGKKYRYGVNDPEWQARDEKTEKCIEEKVRAIADLLGFKVRFNGDPRGGAIRFILPSGASNGWDGETWGIYW